MILLVMRWISVDVPVLDYLDELERVRVGARRSNGCGPAALADGRCDVFLGHSGVYRAWSAALVRQADWRALGGWGRAWAVRLASWQARPGSGQPPREDDDQQEPNNAYDERGPDPPVHGLRQRLAGNAVVVAVEPVLVATRRSTCALEE